MNDFVNIIIVGDDIAFPTKSRSLIAWFIQNISDTLKVYLLGNLIFKMGGTWQNIHMDFIFVRNSTSKDYHPT